MNECSICSGRADDEFKRVLIWEDERWRLTLSKFRAVRGFCYLEPKRHIEYITKLDGEEARDFGSILARATSALKEATGSNLVYVYIYGDHIAHLHIHLAPHTQGDLFADDVVKSGVEFDESVLEAKEILNISRGIVEHLNGKK